MKHAGRETANIGWKFAQLAVIVFAATIMAAGPAGAISLSFEPSAQTKNLGDAVSVDLVVSGLAAASEIVSAYDLGVTWDPAILDFAALDFGSLLGGPANSIQGSVLSSDRLDLFELSLFFDADLAALQDDSVTLATLRFTALAAGKSPLEFDPDTFPGIDVKGLNAEVLSLDVTNGSVTVLGGGQTVPEPGTLLLLGSGLLGLVGTGLRRRRRG